MQALTLSQVFAILWLRKLLVMGITLLVVALALAANLLEAPSYVAQVSLVVDSRRPDMLTGTIDPGPSISSVIATEVDVIASHNVAAKVVDELKLTDDAARKQQFLQETGGAGGTIQDWMAEKLLSKIKVRPARESSVITVEVQDRDPDFAARLANGVADAYIRTNLELRVVPARRQSEWFEEQVQVLRTHVEIAQQKLLAHQRDRQISNVDERLDVENARLAELSTRLVGGQAGLVTAETRARQLEQATGRGNVAELPDILGNPLLQSMKADLVKAEGRLADISQRFDRNHPQYRSAAAQVSSLREKFTAELTTVTGSIRQELQIAQRQNSELQRAVADQNARLLQLKEQRGVLDVLNRDVQNAQQAYDNAIQRAGQLKLESEVNQTSIAILNRALAPREPARPRIFLNVCIAALVGGMLAAAVAVGLEILRRPVRRSSDLTDGTDLVVLAELPRFVTFEPQQA